jgi:hypothetical protein
MAKIQNKKSGGAKKYGRNKAKCEAYSRSGRRLANKVKKFIKNNIPKTATEEEKTSLVSRFKNMQAERKKGRKSV